MKLSRFALSLLLMALLLITWNSQVVAAEPGSVTGSVYCDKDKNGTCDCEEGGLEGIHIQIFVEHCGGTALQTIHTDKQGNFAFQKVEPGTYFIKVDLDYVCGGRVPTTANCRQITLASGETINLPAFGYSEYGQ